MRPIKVVQVSGNSVGGGTRFVMRVVGGLDPDRFALTIVAPEVPWLVEACQRAGATFRPLPLITSRTSPRLVRGLEAILREVRPDIIHAHGTRAAWFARWSLPAGQPRPAILYSEHAFAFEAHSGITRPLWVAIERSLCRWADYLTISHRANAQRLVTARWVAAERIRIDHYGIELDHVRQQAAEPLAPEELGIDRGSVIVGALGRLIEQKGFVYLVDAAPRILRDVPTAVFVVVGDGVQRAALEHHARTLGVADAFRFVGAHEQPWRVLAQCDVIALPSLWEGLPAVTLEAMALGRAVVTTPVGGNPEVIISERSGLLVPPRDSGALADAILRLLRDPEGRRAMGTAATQIVRGYDWRDTMAGFTALYDELAARRLSDAQDAMLVPYQDALSSMRAEESSDG